MPSRGLLNWLIENAKEKCKQFWEGFLIFQEASISCVKIYTCRNASWFCLPSLPSVQFKEAPSSALSMAIWNHQAKSNRKSFTGAFFSCWGYSCFCHRENKFFPTSVAAVWSLLLICVPLCIIMANTICTVHMTEKHFIQRQQKRLSGFWGRNQAIGGHAGLCPALRMIARGQGRPQRRQRKEKRLRDWPFYISCLW